jgi:hypothetical protein
MMKPIIFAVSSHKRHKSVKGISILQNQHIVVTINCLISDQMKGQCNQYLDLFMNNYSATKCKAFFSITYLRKL